MCDDTVLKQGLDELMLDYTDEQLSKLHTYYERMVEVNKVMNLTAITEYEEVCVKHWLDSVSLVKALLPKELNKPLRVIDVGTGAGFPGVPLKIFFPQWKIMLLDSLGKRVKFLEQVTTELGLTDVTCIHGRAEELGRQPDYREKYDLCVSRAVTKMASLTELCLPFVAVGGALIAYKSADSDAEINEAAKAIRLMGGTIENREKFTVPCSDYGRCLAVVRKTASTDRKYPRGGGKPMNAPILGA
ncbi:MAG: 16S rRNA (guanine(527)-N(7))-methyltransferase RsmG [Lachnospiraceae bacterium]|nr:16S rRNA (guanine(527)-N(7))-methyltransferase RsmG [Lachnospiraceae bacterium]